MLANVLAKMLENASILNSVSVVRVVSIMLA
jgi:hypothetical protein